MNTTQLQRINLENHEVIINNEPKKLSLSPGDVVHQGDLTLVSIKKLPKSAKEIQEKQLATGNTKGSRHILENGKVYKANSNEICDLIKEVCPKSKVVGKYTDIVFLTPSILTHPEHGDHVYETEGCIAVVHQRIWDQEEKERKVLD